MTDRSPLVLNPPPNITRVVDATGLAKLQDFFNRCGNECGWDIETTPLKDFFWRKVRTIQFGNAQEQYVIDLKAFCHVDPARMVADALYDAQGYYGKNVAFFLKPVLDVIEPVLTNPNFLKVGVNLGFEYMTMYWNFGIRSCGFWDCSLAERVIYAGLHSLKDYEFYSLEEMFGRYFLMQVDKTLQTSFDLEGELSDAQCEYAALDTRTPIAIRTIQLLILSGKTPRGLLAAGKPKLAEYLRRVDPLVLGDNLMESAKIENDAIGAFQDMHIHGERIDRPRWMARYEKNFAVYMDLIRNTLDPIFLPLVGSKHENLTDEQIAVLEADWKSYNNPSNEEIQLRGALRVARRSYPDNVENLTQQLAQLEEQRKVIKEEKKKLCSEAKRRRTKIRNLAEKCEGEALINYGSDAQLLKVLKENFARLEKLDGLDDEVLEKYDSIPVMKAIHEYHRLSKEIGTYGLSWVTEWKTGPSKDEGWLHPGDGKLHSKFNQFDAETGRSSSEQPNGQNLPKDKEVRMSFIADPPDENIRISDCCESEANWAGTNFDGTIYICSKCNQTCSTHAEEYVYVTADMSGAELRIIAEAADDPIWIGAFNRGEDVHSVGTEILYPEEWPAAATPDCDYFKTHTEETVAKNPLCTLGDPLRHKCECPKHKELRDDNKSTNFLLAYGGGPSTLAKRIKKTLSAASKLMALHAQKFPKIWAYLEKSGKDAQMQGKAFDLFGGRRIFPPPTQERAKATFIEYHADRLELDKETQDKNIAGFVVMWGRKPSKEEMFVLTHRSPTNNEITKQFIAISSGIERKGKNHRIQGTNARIAKVSLGSGFDKDGKPFLWHTLPQFNAKLVKFVHDEVVVQCPRRYAHAVADLIGDAFRRAGAMVMHKVTMEFDFKIAGFWSK